MTNAHPEYFNSELVKKDYDPNLNLEISRFLIGQDLVHHVIIQGETGQTVLITKDKVIPFGHSEHLEGESR